MYIHVLHVPCSTTQDPHQICFMCMCMCVCVCFAIMFCYSIGCPQGIPRTSKSCGTLEPMASKAALVSSDPLMATQTLNFFAAETGVALANLQNTGSLSIRFSTVKHGLSHLQATTNAPEDTPLKTSPHVCKEYGRQKGSSNTNCTKYIEREVALSWSSLWVALVFFKHLYRSSN